MNQRTRLKEARIQVANNALRFFQTKKETDECTDKFAAPLVTQALGLAYRDMYTRRASSYCSGDRRPGAGDADNNGGGANSMLSLIHI